MAKKRVFLDENLPPNLGRCFGSKAHVYTARDLGVQGVEDTRVIDRAVGKKCLIVTANKDFVHYYKHHPLRKGQTISYFYGLIFLKPCTYISVELRLKKALKEIAWDETRDHDDLVTIHADGRTTSHERLCHAECAKEFSMQERGTER